MARELRPRFGRRRTQMREAGRYSIVRTGCGVGAMRAWVAGLALCALAGGMAPMGAEADVILRLPTDARVVALTFDACEQKRPMTLDTGISDYLVAHRVP